MSLPTLFLSNTSPKVRSSGRGILHPLIPDPPPPSSLVPSDPVPRDQPVESQRDPSGESGRFLQGRLQRCAPGETGVAQKKGREETRSQEKPGKEAALERNAGPGRQIGTEKSRLSLFKIRDLL